MKYALSIVVLITSSLVACTQPEKHPQPRTNHSKPMSTSQRDTATLAGGCFWCIEAVFQRLEGVDTVLSGYSGGTTDDADYQTVSTGKTNHAETCQIIYDPAVLSYEDILQVFFSAHDPTTLNRQGNDVGKQYRSVIFYHNQDQKDVASAYIKQLTNAHTWSDSIVTELTPYTGFFEAESYHQNYFNQNGSQPYCAFVVRPKVEKFMKLFKGQVKEQYK